MHISLSTDDLRAIEVIVQGRVQGVGFRAFTRRNAMLLGLRGTVSNQPDGTVKAYIEGNKARVQQMIHLLKEGPSLALVERVDVVSTQPLGQYRTFEVGFN